MRGKREGKRQPPTSLHEMVELLRKASNAYFNSEPIMTDSEYDTLVETVRGMDPNHPVLDEVGAAAPPHAKKVSLPYYLGSMNKISADEGKLLRWVSKFSNKQGYVISDKLDGVSSLLVCNTIEDVKMYSRGDGRIGQDISKLVSKINGDLLQVLKGVTSKMPFAVRGELIVTKANFEEIAKRKKVANARNFVSGIVNAKRVQNDLVRYVDFVCYEVIQPESLRPSEQFAWLQEAGLNMSPYVIRNENETLTVADLSKTLLDRRTNSPYEVDGIIVTHNHTYPRRDGENPSHSVAFKSAVFQDRTETFVEEVEWNISKDGYFIPRVRVQPIHIAGVTVTFATGNNAAFIVKNGIGPGAKITIIRSGDVIPKITEVLSPVEPVMPNTEWKWDKTNTHILSTSTSEPMMREKNIKELLYFFESLSVKSHGIKAGVITKLYDAGFTNVQKMLEMQDTDLSKVPGFKGKSIVNFLASIDAIKSNMTCKDILVGSNRFGRGISLKKIEAVEDMYPNFLSDGVTESQLLQVKGIAKTTAQGFLDGLQAAKSFIQENELMKYCMRDKGKDKDNNTQQNGQEQEQEEEYVQVYKFGVAKKRLEGKKVLFTGFRNDACEALVKAHGGVMASSVSKQLHILVYNEENEQKSFAKLEKARELGITTMTRSDLFQLLR